MTICYLSLGSNLSPSERRLRQTINLLRYLPRSCLIQCSSLYLSEAWGLRAQPHYVNLVASIKTSLPPKLLLAHCQRIEKQQHRVRKKKWGARTVDIDILLFGQRQICTPQLIIPHPRMLERDFVLAPLLEIAPHLTLPNGQKIAQFLPYCASHLIF